MKDNVKKNKLDNDNLLLSDAVVCKVELDLK